MNKGYILGEIATINYKIGLIDINLSNLKEGEDIQREYLTVVKMLNESLLYRYKQKLDKSPVEGVF